MSRFLSDALGTLVTKNLSKVRILGNEVVTLDGFNVYREARILMSEKVKVLGSNEDEEVKNNTIEMDSSTVNVKPNGGNGNDATLNPHKSEFMTIQVIHLNRPLMGGVDAPDSSEEVAEVNELFFSLSHCAKRCR